MMEILRNPARLNFYHLLEKDLEECFRYVEPCEVHHKMHSDQFARIILMSAAEIENALRDFYRVRKDTGQTRIKKAVNIHQWHGVVIEKFPKFD